MQNRAGGSHGERAGRRTRALIDPEAFAHNVRLAARLAGPGRQVLAVVKADAYGHGAAALAGAALAAGAAKLGVATLGEARTLREAGIDRPILVMDEIAREAAAEAVRLACALTVYTLVLAEALERAAARSGRKQENNSKDDQCCVMKAS